MTGIQKILMAIDFSGPSAAAFDRALALAKQLDARLHLLHCYQVNLGALSPYGPVLDDRIDVEMRIAAERELAEWVEKAAAGGVRVEAQVTPNFPSEAIAATAREIGADLVVMGTRGLSGFKHVLLGSVAERTVRTAPCPVLTVRGEDG